MVQWAVSVMIMLVSREKFCMTSEWTIEIASLLFSNHFITSHCSHISMYSYKYRDHSHCTHMSNTKERNLPYHNSNSNGCISCFAYKGSLATYWEHFWENIIVVLYNDTSWKQACLQIEQDFLKWPLWNYFTSKCKNSNVLSDAHVQGF